VRPDKPAASKPYIIVFLFDLIELCFCCCYPTPPLLKRLQTRIPMNSQVVVLSLSNPKIREAGTQGIN
jgi:hypothetical protein